MICSSVNLDRFIVRPLRWAGLYSNLEEIQGLRSDNRRALDRLADTPQGNSSSLATAMDQALNVALKDDSIIEFCDRAILAIAEKARDLV
jgi:hypothetical protein